MIMFYRSNHDDVCGRGCDLCQASGSCGVHGTVIQQQKGVERSEQYFQKGTLCSTNFFTATIALRFAYVPLYRKQLWPLMCGLQSSQSKKPTTTDFWRLRSLLRDTGALRSVSLCYTSLQHLKHPIMTLTASTSQHLWFQSITPKIKHKPPCPWRKYSVNMNK